MYVTNAPLPETQAPLPGAETVTLEAGMTFTDEPSIMIPGRFSVRIEDVVVVEDGAGRILNDYPKELVSNGVSQ